MQNIVLNVAMNFPRTIQKALIFKMSNSYLQFLKRDGKRSLELLVSLLHLQFSYYAVQQIFFAPPSLNKLMMNAASELNKACPVVVDQYTQLDNAVAMPNNTFQYNYTLIDLEESQVNIDTIEKYLVPEIINNIKTSPDMKLFRDNKVTLAYYYKDKNGVFVWKLIVTPDMYR